MFEDFLSLPLEQHVINLTGAIGLLAFVDHFAVKPLLASRPERLKQRAENNCRWYLVHAFANLLVCISALPAVWTTMTDPTNAMNWDKYHDISVFGRASVWPLTFVNAVHIYHMVGGFGLSSADYFHHLLFIPALGLPGMVLRWGPVHPSGAFYISGLPGGICYVMLALLKLGYFTPMIEKRWTANLNTWVRAPGIMINSFIVYQAVLYGNYAADFVPLWLSIPLMVLPPYNALYYNKQACANFAVHWMTSILSQDNTIKEKMAKLTSESLAVPESTCAGTIGSLSWKEAVALPQRGC